MQVNLIFFLFIAEFKTFVKSTNGIDSIFSVSLFPWDCLFKCNLFLYKSFGFYWFKIAVFYKAIYPAFKIKILLSYWPYLNNMSFFFNFTLYDPSTIYLSFSFLKRLKQLNVRKTSIYFVRLLLYYSRISSHIFLKSIEKIKFYWAKLINVLEYFFCYVLFLKNFYPTTKNWF